MLILGQPQHPRCESHRLAQRLNHRLATSLEGFPSHQRISHCDMGPDLTLRSTPLGDVLDVTDDVSWLGLDLGDRGSKVANFSVPP
jgi:hypothetical protein